MNEEIRPNSGPSEPALQRWQPGDMIQEVNRQPVLTVDELRAAVNLRSHNPMLLVNRAGHGLSLTARVHNV